ncbi:MAG: hypothetical protein ACHQF2_06225, partial [Flavobacteriales bacterium]
YYTDRSTADIYKYYDDARVMYNALWDQPEDYFRMVFGIGNDNDYFNGKYYSNMNHWFRVWETVVYNDNHTIIRWNAVVMLFSGGNFHVHTVFMCFFSFLGTWFILKALARFLPEGKRKWFAFVLFLFPSYIFWTSGVLKEGLLIFGGGIVLFLAIESMARSLRWYEWIIGFGCVYLLFHLKSYFLLALLPGWVGYVWCCSVQVKRVWIPFFIIFATGIMAFVLLPYINPDYHMGGVFKQKQDDFYRLASFMNSGSIISIPQLDGSYADLLLKSFPAFFNGLFRPLPGESFSPLVVISSLETLFPMSVVIYLLIKRPVIDKADLSLVFFLLSFITILMVFSGLVTPVLGALVRYRVPCLPFIVFLGVYFLPEKIIPSFLRKK